MADSIDLGSDGSVAGLWLSTLEIFTNATKLTVVNVRTQNLRWVYDKDSYFWHGRNDYEEVILQKLNECVVQLQEGKGNG